MNKNKLIKAGQLIWMNKWYYLGSVTVLLLAVLLELIQPLMLGETVDRYLLGGESNLPAFVNRWVDQLGGPEWMAHHLWLVGALLLVVSILAGVCNYFQVRWQSMAGENIAVYLRDRIYTHLQKLPYSYHVKAEAGDLVQRCTNDLETVRHFLGNRILDTVCAVLTLVTALFYLLRENVRLTLLCMVLVPPLMFFVMRFYHWIRNAFTESDEADGAMSSVLQENLTGVRVVRAFGRQQFEQEKFERVSKDYRDKTLVLSRLLSAYAAGSHMLSACQTMMTLLLCTVFAIRGEISVGTVIIFTTYVHRVMWPVRELGGVLSDAGKCSVSLNRIREVTTQPIEPEEPNAKKPPLNGDIVFENVSFVYDGGHQVLKDVSFTIPAGKTTAILGATGSGKSSLVHLLQRLYDVDQGRITIGGVDIKDIDRTYLRTHVGLVLQEPFLYSKTLKENVGIALRNPSDEEIDRAVTDASAKEFILRSTNGFDTVVGERGVTLSGGQKQRVSIARTLMKDNDVLIFDDSLSAVDTATDARIREALKKRSKDITTIIISHRVTTLSQADQILVLEGGKITESGSHDELVKGNGLYSRIFDIQSIAE